MPITRPKPKSRPQEEEAFIAGAPDAPARPSVAGIRRGNKQQISLTIAPELLIRIDQLAQQMGQTRAGLISLAVYRMLENWRPGEAREEISRFGE
jgi:hypothetical protein